MHTSMLPFILLLASQVTGSEVVVGQPCEGCEHVFTGLPAKLSTVGALSPRGEPGEPCAFPAR